MRWAIAVLAALAVGTADGGAQERTLVGDHVESGGFGAPVVKFTEVLGDFAVLAGGRGAWIIDHTIMIGGGGYGLVNDVYDFRLVPAPRIQFGYGGLELAVVAASNSVVHFSVMSLVGGGGIQMGAPGPTDAVFVVEPQLNVVVNVTPYMRFAAGGGYRWVTDVDWYPLTDGDMSAWQVSLALKFGRF